LTIILSWSTTCLKTRSFRFRKYYSTNLKICQTRANSRFLRRSRDSCLMTTTSICTCRSWGIWCKRQEEIPNLSYPLPSSHQKCKSVSERSRQILLSENMIMTEASAPELNSPQLNKLALVKLTFKHMLRLVNQSIQTRWSRTSK